MNSESYDEETNKELLSDITSLCSLSDTIMQERLNALEKDGQTLDKICCYRNMNGGRCKEVNCPYSHSLEDQALYYKLKLNKVEQDIAAKGQKLHAVETSLDSNNHEATWREPPGSLGKNRKKGFSLADDELHASQLRSLVSVLTKDPIHAKAALHALDTLQSKSNIEVRQIAAFMQVCGRVQLSTGGNPRVCPTKIYIYIYLQLIGG